MAAPPLESLWVRMDGQNLPLSEARIGVADHGLLFGDSIYETMRTVQGRVFRLSDHLLRLRRSAAGIHLELPWSDAALQAEIEALRNHLGPTHDHYLRVVITRGPGALSYRRQSNQRPTLMILGGPFAECSDTELDRGLSAVVVSIRRNSPLALSPGLKTGNLLNQRLAAMEAEERGADEAILLNHQGNLSEAATSNIFLVLPGGLLATPALESGLLAGVTRQVVLELAHQLEIPIRETTLEADLLSQAEEMFLSNTTRSIAPIRSIDGRALSLPGPVTSRLRAAFRSYMECL